MYFGWVGIGYLNCLEQVAWVLEAMNNLQRVILCAAHLDKLRIHAYCLALPMIDTQKPLQVWGYIVLSAIDTPISTGIPCIDSIAAMNSI